MEPKILNMKNEGAIILGSYGKTEKKWCEAEAVGLTNGDTVAGEVGEKPGKTVRTAHKAM